MSWQNIYARELTEEEKGLGLQKVLIQYPTPYSLGVPNLIVAVVYILGPGARIVNLSCAVGRKFPLFSTPPRANSLSFA